MAVQNSDSKMPAHTELATILLQILLPTTFYSPLEYWVNKMDVGGVKVLINVHGELALVSFKL